MYKNWGFVLWFDRKKIFVEDFVIDFKKKKKNIKIKLNKKMLWCEGEVCVSG